MNRMAFYVASAAIAFSVPAFADADNAPTGASNAQPVAASVRTLDVTFDLRSQRGLSGAPIPAQSDATFASFDEVKAEDYSFDLK